MTATLLGAHVGGSVILWLGYVVTAQYPKSTGPWQVLAKTN